MAWCPKCKNEYREGISSCVDCGCDLVDSLTTTTNEPIFFGEKAEMDQIKAFLLFNKFTSVEIQYNETDVIYELFAGEKERERAAKAVAVFLQQKALEESENEEVTETKVQEPAKYEPLKHSFVYQNSTKRAEEFKSGAYTLLLVGILGLIGIVLIFSGVLVLNLSVMNRYMVSGVMGALFVLFIVMGALSLKSSKTLEIKAEEENSLTTELRNWCLKNLFAKEIDAALSDELGTNEEANYFKRIEFMKHKIKEKFMNLEDDFLDDFLDDLYTTVYHNHESNIES